MINLGKVKPGSTIYVPFDTFDGGTGASITMSGLAVGDILIYKDGGVTQRASTSGFTLLDTDGIDFDAITGVHGFSIDLADNTTAGFYAAGSKYFIAVSTITVDAQTVSFVAATFEIGFEGAVLNTTIATLSTQTSFTLTNGPAEDDAINGCVVCIHDVASAVQEGYAVVSDYTGATKTVTLVAGTTFTAAASDNIAIFPPTNVHYWLGTQAATPTVAGVPEVDVTHFNGTAGTFASGRPEVNTSHIAGSAVSTTTAQIGVNVVQISTDSVAADNCELFFDGTGYAGGTTKLDVNVNQISTDATAADNLEAMFDNTGYTASASTIGTVSTVTALGATAKSDVNAEVVDALATDTYAEPAQGAPAATAALSTKLGFLYKAWRNRSTQTASQYSLYNDDTTTIDHKATVSDDGTTFDRTEIATGP